MWIFDLFERVSTHLRVLHQGFRAFCTFFAGRLGFICAQSGKKKVAAVLFPYVIERDSGEHGRLRTWKLF